MTLTRWLRDLRSAITPGRKERKLRRQSACRRPHLETLEDRCLLTFSPAASYATGTGPLAVVTADLNSDTIQDLVTANLGSNAVSVLLGNADGTFQAAQTTATGAIPRSVAVGDFNTDGKLDLVTANANSYDVSVLLGRGDGTFEPAVSVGAGSSLQSVAVGDFNSDGKLDLGVLSNTYVPGYWGPYGSYPGYYLGYANVLVGDGAGSFAFSSSSALGYGFHTSAAVADFNGDFKLDIAATSDYGYVLVGLGTGTGSFGSALTFGGTYLNSLTAGDVNNDDKVDLVGVNPGTESVNVLLGNGLGSFGSVQAFAASSAPQSVALADFNGDGHIDLATSNSTTGTASVLLGTGNGAFKPPVAAAVNAVPYGVVVGDFNSDDRPDVATANFSANNVSALLNDGAWPSLEAPSISVNDVTVAEGNAGTVSATFTLSLSAASGQAVSVRYATAPLSATSAGGDYQDVVGTLSFAPGVTSQTVTVLVNGDRLAETNESFMVLLTDATNAFVADAKGVGSIMDDEPHVSIDYGPTYVTEGNTGTTTALFTVRLTNAYDAPVAVNYSTAEGDTEWWSAGWYYAPPAASHGSDLQESTGTLTCAPGETVKTLPIAVLGDRVGESDEYFSVNLSGSATAPVDSAHAVGVIVDDEPRVSIGSASVAEENSGTKAMTFTVALTTASDAPVTVSYTTTDQTATAASDYQATAGTLTFAPGETTKTITVQVKGDRVGEYEEYLTVNLTGATNAIINGDTGYGTIYDNEPRINVNSRSITEGNKGTKLMTFTVTLSAAYDQAVTVRYATEDGSATVAGNDYVAAAGLLTFAPGETTKTFTVKIKGDTKKEWDEYFNVSLTDASSNALVEYGYGYGEILNDDGRPRGRG